MRLPSVSWNRVLATTKSVAAQVAAALVIALGFGAHSLSFAEARDATRIGYLTLDSVPVHAPFAAAFRQGLRDSGLIEGKDIAIEWRFAAYNASALPELASELVGLRVHVLVADGTQAALAAKHATRIIPIVVSTSGDLVGAGLLESLARPGGNLTGLTVMSPGLVGKRLALLKEMLPSLRRVAVLVNPDNPNSQLQLNEAQAAAPRLGLELRPVSIRQREDIDHVVPSLAGRFEAMLVADDMVLDASRTQIGTLALQNRLPWLCGYPMPEDKVCLIWYGPDLPNMFRRAAGYVARILGGAKPADLPVEQPTKFVLGINMTTAKALGIAVPESLRVAADRIIR